MNDVADDEFISVQCESVATTTDPETKRVTVQRVYRWTTPEDYVRWVPLDDDTLSPSQILAMVNCGKLREAPGGGVLQPGGVLSEAEVMAKLDHPITDEELADLQAKLDRDWARTRGRKRECCPWCWGFAIQKRGGDVACPCGWNSKQEPGHTHLRLMP